MPQVPYPYNRNSSMISQSNRTCSRNSNNAISDRKYRKYSVKNVDAVIESMPGKKVMHCGILIHRAH